MAGNSSEQMKFYQFIDNTVKKQYKFTPLIRILI